MFTSLVSLTVSCGAVFESETSVEGELFERISSPNLVDSEMNINSTRNKITKNQPSASELENGEDIYNSDQKIRVNSNVKIQDAQPASRLKQIVNRDFIINPLVNTNNIKQRYIVDRTFITNPLMNPYKRIPIVDDQTPKPDTSVAEETKPEFEETKPEFLDNEPIIENAVNGVATGPINTNNRASVVDAYNSWFLKSVPSMGWVGSIHNCEPNNTSLDYQQRVIDQVNYYRAMAGLEPAELDTNNSKYQAAALIMAANRKLSHNPSSDWKCYTEEGHRGARSSNLAIHSGSGMRAIDLYMEDFGINNARVGHRRWILTPSISHFAVGDVPGSNSLQTIGNRRGEAKSKLGFVAWPSPGYIPYKVVPKGSNRWSFSKKGASLSEAVVIVKNISENITYEIESKSYPSNIGYAPAIVFSPKNFNYSRPTKDTVIQVTVSNVKEGSEYKHYTYNVTLIDPSITMDTN